MAGKKTQGAAGGKSQHLDVAELVSDRPAAPSPFGDDQTFPLPLSALRHTPSHATSATPGTGPATPQQH